MTVYPIFSKQIHWAMVITSWERWYVIQPPRMAFHNDVKVDVASPKVSQQPDVTLNPSLPYQDQQLPSTTAGPDVNAPPYFPPSSSPINSNFPASGRQQQQQQYTYHDNMNQIDPSGTGPYPSHYPNNYIPPENQQQPEPKVDFDPRYYQQYPADFDPRHHQQQYQQHEHDPYRSQQNNPYAAAHQPYPSANVGTGEDGYYRY
jgi:hypothetical protein